MRLDGKAVLITGAGSGIGRALAVEAAARNPALYLIGRRIEALEETRRQLESGAEAHLVVADITKVKGRQTVRRAVEAGGRGLDLLFNNAGFIAIGSLSTCSDGDALRMIETNLVAPILLTRDLLPPLARPPAGRIVNVGSIYGDIAAPDFSVYAATKFGLRGFSDALRREVAAEGIGVTYVAPRGTRTAGVEPFAAALECQGTVLDDPAEVARWIWAAVDRERRSAYPPTAERLFVALQRLLPSLIDRALRKKKAPNWREGPGSLEASAADRLHGGG